MLSIVKPPRLSRYNLDVQIPQDDMIIALMLRKMRRDREKSQDAVAVHLNLPQNVVSRMEKGERRITLPELRAICEFFEVPLLDFVAEYLQRRSH